MMMTTMTVPQHDDDDHQHDRPSLTRRPSLTSEEMIVLSALLIDDPAEEKDISDNSKEKDERKPLTLDLSFSDEGIKSSPSRVLDNDMLFTLPTVGGIPLLDDAERKKTKHPNVIKKPQQYRFLVGLWQAFEDGVPPTALSGILGGRAKHEHVKQDIVTNHEPAENTPPLTAGTIEESSAAAGADPSIDHDADTSGKSDVEVCEVPDDFSDVSWEDEATSHFDAWQVLKDEYAKENGFDYTPDGFFPEDDDAMEHNTFRILGTSAEDTSSHPHVLSPPLMDAIMNFLPDYVQGQNLWLKYSLVRDGASLETFKQYSRASKETILAIETTKGHVFGCYVSQPWRTSPTFYGGEPSFVFKMRHSRNTPCHSLIDQAQMEGEIDVYFLLQEGLHPQVCTQKLLGVGEGSVQKYGSEGNVMETMEEAEALHGKNFGFAIALNDDLLSGTTSKCSSYQNPCLVDATSNGEPFEVLNLELWTLTPCFSLDSAEKSEMTQFFVQQSVRNMSMMSASSIHTNNPSPFSSQDLDRDKFYRRIGQGDDHEELREQWQYQNTMNGHGVQSPRGMGASPRFSNSTT